MAGIFVEVYRLFSGPDMPKQRRRDKPFMGLRTPPHLHTLGD